MCDVWTGVADIAIHLAHHPNVFVAVEQRILLLSSWSAWPTAIAVSCPICFERSVRQHYDQSLG